MATYTSYLNLEKPATSENFNLLKINQNWDKIDAGFSSLSNQIANMAYGDITSQCTINENTIAAANIYRYGNIVIATGSTKTSINGTNITLITLPFNVKKSTAYIGCYGGGFVGECIFNNNSKDLKANISSSTNNGVFNIVTYIA